MFMFTGFSEKANTALNNAVNCAEDMGHTYIGSEHIVLGLLKDPGSVAGVILGAHRINYQVFYSLISDCVGLGIPTSLSEKDITPRAADIIRTAVSLSAAPSCASAAKAVEADNPIARLNAIANTLLFFIMQPPRSFLLQSSLHPSSLRKADR